VAAPTEVYVDPAIAGDSGTGTIGDPYGDLQFALDSATRDATNGDRFNIKAGTDEILAAALSLVTYGTPTFDAPLIFEGYTSAAGDGGIGGIDGNNGNFTIFAGAASVHFINMHLHNTGTATVVTVAMRSIITGCEVNNSSGGGIVINNNETVCDSNHVHDIGGVGINRTGGTAGGNILRNYLKNDGTNDFTTAISINTTFADCARNIISIDGASNGIATTDRSNITRNSILSAGGTGKGISVSATSKLVASLHSNLVEGFSGVGGEGIEIPVGTRQMAIYGKNAVFNCTTAYDVDTVDIMVLLGDNETLSVTPFAKSGADTFANRLAYFAPVDTGNVIGGAY